MRAMKLRATLHQQHYYYHMGAVLSLHLVGYLLLSRLSSLSQSRARSFLVKKKIETETSALDIQWERGKHPLLVVVVLLLEEGSALYAPSLLTD